MTPPSPPVEPRASEPPESPDDALHLALAEQLPGYRYVPDDAPRASSAPTCRLCPCCGGRPLRPAGHFMVCDDCRVATAG